jgi:serine/threonine-protein kinase
MAADLQTARDGAQQRLTEAVSALETIRLELLRMHAGAGSVVSMTQDLTAARALSVDIEHMLHGKREVARLLASGGDG